MKRLLLVSYYFPPSNTMGAVRIGKFAKFLPRWGWEPYILTVKPELTGTPQDLPLETERHRAITAGWGALASRLSSMIKREQGTIGSARKRNQAASRSRQHDLSRRFVRYVWSKLSTVRLPDRSFPWYRQATAEGMRFLQHDRMDAIFSSSGPVGSHIVASILARRTGIPWVADYRDLWSQNHVVKYHPILTIVEKRIERAVLSPCRAAVTVSPPLAKELNALLQKPVIVIPNGFDPDDYDPRTKPLLRFTLTYTGRLYPPHRDPSVLFEAVTGLKSEGVTPDRLSLRLYSPPDVSPAFVMGSAKRFGVEDFVEWGGYVPYLDSLRRQQESTVLLVIDFTGAEGILTGKIFEYLGAGRPILALGSPAGVIASLLERTKAGVMLSTAQQIKGQLKVWLKEFESSGNIAYAPDQDEVRKYSREEQARLLAKFLEGFTSEAYPRSCMTLSEFEGSVSLEGRDKSTPPKEEHAREESC